MDTNTTSIWIEKPSYSEYTTFNFEYKQKIAFFDLDDTLTKSSKGNKTPSWEWAYPNVIQKLHALYDDNYCIIIITNQKNLVVGTPNYKTWSQKIELVFKKIQDSNPNIPLKLWVAIGESVYRKPMTGFFDQFVTPAIKVDYSTTFFCGDAAGRPGDFADTDLKFALNCLINFKTPEHFFSDEPNQFPPIKYPNLNALIDIDGLKQFVPHPKELIVCVGFPGSGKSTVAKRLHNEHKYIVINQDTLKTKKKCLDALQYAISRSESIIIDNTNPDVKTRSTYMELAKNNNYPVRCIIMLTDLATSKHNNYFRHYKDQTKLVPKIAYDVYKKKFQAPSLEEGFTEIIEVEPGISRDLLHMKFLY